MRNLEFRAWHKNNKSMCYNVTTDLLDRDYLEFMQYIGLKDKNDKKIYEGDIIKHKYGSEKIISYKNGAFVMSHENSNIHLLYDLIIEDGYLMDWEVVGNIYEKEKYRC